MALLEADSQTAANTVGVNRWWMCSAKEMRRFAILLQAQPKQKFTPAEWIKNKV